MQVRQVALKEIRVASRFLLQVRNGALRLFRAACGNVDFCIARQEHFGGFFSDAWFVVGMGRRPPG